MNDMYKIINKDNIMQHNIFIHIFIKYKINK